MSPVTLLFSSDEETSRQLTQALIELELDVKPCPDVFTAVEWLTSRSFDVIAADWDNGPEAGFLLKNARDLKLNKAAFTIGLTSGASRRANENEEDGPDLVLIKPLISDQVKYSVLSNDRFLACMKAWIARGDFAQAQGTASSASHEGRRTQSEQPSPMPPPAHPLEPSPTTGRARGGAGAPLHLTFATLDRRLFRSINQRNNDGVPGKVRRYRPNKFLWGTVLSAAFISVGCIFGQPWRVQSVFASVATAYKQALEMKSSELQETEDAANQNSAVLAQAAASRRNGLGRSPSSRSRAPLQPEVPLDHTPLSAEVLQADVSLDQDRFAAPTSRVLIPESLKIPQPEAATVRTVSVKRSPSLLSQLEPVNLPENLSQGVALAEGAAQLSGSSFESRPAGSCGFAGLDWQGWQHPRLEAG